MAIKGIGFFDGRGGFFRDPNDATISDLAAVFGRVGEHDSLAPGIAKILFDKRREIERIFGDHDLMIQGMEGPLRKPVLVADNAVGTPHLAAKSA